MRIALAAFTAKGEALAARLSEALCAAGDDARASRCGRREYGDPGGERTGVREWAAENFRGADALVFVGAAGIAVRAVAPLLSHKAEDPAVVVIDDGGRFAISLLSGHLGGANALAARLGKIIGAVPVVTTATDGAGVFAADEWARREGLIVVNPERVRAVSAKLLAGGVVRLRTAFPVRGAAPENVLIVSGEEGEGGAEAAADIVVAAGSLRGAAEASVLRLVPRAIILGIGCRKGVSMEAAENAFAEFCGRTGIPAAAFAAAASIDLKKNEAGLLAFCEARGLPLSTFSAEALARVSPPEGGGGFSASAFVEAAAGVDNVCERAAVAAGGGRLIEGKTALSGVTMACAARKDFALRFAGGGGEGE